VCVEIHATVVGRRSAIDHAASRSIVERHVLAVCEGEGDGGGLARGLVHDRCSVLTAVPAAVVARVGLAEGRADGRRRVVWGRR
jgi:hypothetical protein